MTLHDHLRKRYRFRGLGDNLPFSSARGTREIFGELFADLGFTVGAELGVREGRFSKTLLDANPELKLFCVDPYMPESRRLTKARQDEYFKVARKNLKGYNVEFIRKTSIQALSDFDDSSLDFVYIDGNHRFDYCCPDIIYWSHKVKKGGIVAVHDYNILYKGGVVKAVDAYTHCHHIDPWYVTGREVNPTAFWQKP